MFPLLTQPSPLAANLRLCNFYETQVLLETVIKNRYIVCNEKHLLNLFRKYMWTFFVYQADVMYMETVLYKILFPVLYRLVFLKMAQ